MDEGFPVLFTIAGSSRHEVVLISDPLPDLDELRSTIEGATQSPNCAEMLHKYRSKDITESVGEVKVRWSMEERDARLWPKETVVTPQNCEAVLRMMRASVGRDVLDVQLRQQNPPAGSRS